jgi:branched-chain amino acid transport system permease protein
VSGLGHAGRDQTLTAWLRRYGAVAALALAVMTVPAYLSDRYYLLIFAQVAWRFIACIGLSLLVGQAGQISLGQAGFMGVGAYGAAILTTRLGLDPWVALLLAAVGALVIAVLVGIPTLRLKGYYLAMATLGINEIILVLLDRLKGLTGGVDGLAGIPSLRLGGLDLGGARSYHLVVWALALLVFIMATNISRSRPGRSLRALHQSEAAAEALGVNTRFRKVQVFALAAVLASVAGSLEAYYQKSGVPGHIWPESYGINLSILLISGVVIGGLRSMWGALWGAVLIVAVPAALERFGLADYTLLVFGVLLVTVTVITQGTARGVVARWSRRCREGLGAAGVRGHSASRDDHGPS